MAPNVSLLVADYDAAALDRAVRAGIAGDGRDLVLAPNLRHRGRQGRGGAAGLCVGM